MQTLFHMCMSGGCGATCTLYITQSDAFNNPQVTLQRNTSWGLVNTVREVHLQVQEEFEIPT